MIFNIDDKKVEVSIPEFVPKLKPDILKKFVEKYDADEMLQQLKHVSKNDHYQKKVETIGIWMSGGADSSLLTYVLAKKIKDENLKINIQPLSVRRGRGWNPIYAGHVIDFIEQNLNIKMNNHIVYYPPMNDEHYREIQVFRDKDNENFSIELLAFYDLENQQAYEVDISTYYDIPKNSWNLIGLKDALNEAKERCLKLANAG